MYAKICVLGGTGFVGRHLCSRLAGGGRRVRVLTRRRERHRELLVLPTLELHECNVHDGLALGGALEGCDAVVNLTGILNERARPGEDFQSVHAELPHTIAQACADSGVSRLLHVSALKASAGAPSAYLRSKAAGEEAVHGAVPRIAVTSFRPSVLFGPGDSFFTRFASLLGLSPLVFPLACAQARFAPVFVEDLVAALTRALDDASTHAQRYDLCGPRQYTLKELVEYTAHVAGFERAVIGLGDTLSRLQARILGLLPMQPFTIDNYRSMQVDSICERNGFAALGIEPVSLECVVPTYIGRQHPNARYQQMRHYARRG